MPEAAPAPATSTGFHGRILDAATAQPIAFVRIRAGALELDADEDGRFSAEQELAADVAELELAELSSRTPLGRVNRDALVPDPNDAGGWLARFAIGPTYRLIAVDVPPGSLAGWSARLIEVAGDGGESVRGEWQPVQDLEPPFLRCPQPWTTTTVNPSFRVELALPDGTSFGISRKLASATDVYPELVPIERSKRYVESAAASGPATLRGRVVDPEESPAPCQVDVWPREQAHGESYWKSTDSGRFEFIDLECARYGLRVTPADGYEPKVLFLELRPGVNDLDPIVVQPRRPIVGRIRGRLINASGKPLRLGCRVHLHPIAGGEDQSTWAGPGGVQSIAPQGVTSFGQSGEQIFAFDVQAGRFAVRVLPSDGTLWDPPALEVEAPSDTLVFRRRDDLERIAVCIRAVDETSGADLRSARVGLFLDGCALDLLALEVTRGTAFSWIVSAPGHRSARGTDRDLVHTARGLEGTIALERGYGVRLVLRAAGLAQMDTVYLDPDAYAQPPVAGAAILADGKHAGTSDAGGFAEIDLERAPEHLEVHAQGWSVLYPWALDLACHQDTEPDVLIWMARD